MILSVFCCCLTQIVGPRTAAAAAAPVVVTNCRRSIPLRLAMGLSLDRSQREPLDEAIEAEVVNDGQQNARERRRGHESPPEVHIAPPLCNRHAQSHRLLVYRDGDGRDIYESTDD